jgi:acetate kinase
METKLIINTGSASKKYALYQGDKRLLFAHVEDGRNTYMISTDCKGIIAEREIAHDVYEDALSSVLRMAQKEQCIERLRDIDTVVIRVVAPGAYFAQHRPIDEEYLKRLKEMLSCAPLHIIPVLNEIRQCKKSMREARLFAASDSAFHASLASVARDYGIVKADADALDVHRFGYHGLSMGSVLRKVPELSGGWSPQRAIVVHLGGGASVAAIHTGVSIDTSMGFSPDSGLVMGSRAGDIDAGALLYLMEKKKVSLKKMREYITVECGFKGLAGTSDMRELLKRRYSGDDAAKEAIDLFMYRIKKYIGSYVAVLGGLDLLILTGTMNERNMHIRREVCAGLEHFGISINTEKNTMLGEKEGYINEEGEVGVVVVHSNEMEEMAGVDV